MAHSSNPNLLIQGGTFYSAQGDFHINNRDSESGLRDLKLGVSLEAFHDSAERYPPPNCHPDTRKAVRQIIIDWIHDESSSSFLWLSGPAGAGKTAILQAIAELCSPSESGQNFGGSFFFSRGKQGRDQGRFLLSTIGYQLALRVPGLRRHVNHIMELDPTLHTKSMDIQLQTLIVNAFRKLSPLPQRSYLVIIDGLDECHDKADQQLILQLLCEAITIHKLPLRFLIGSRPESHIRASFDQESLYTITRRVVLDETFNPGRDIRVLLQDGFAKFCAENSILSHVEKPWPSRGIIDLLVQRSSGQFIYAATVLKFVGADFCSPTEQLALVLKPDPTAFSDLDQLYTQILSVFPSAVNIVQILGIIIASEWSFPEVIEDILGMEKGKLKLVLRGLSSLMKDDINDNKECLEKGVISYVIPPFAHASFSDYLFNSSRSAQFHVDRQEYENQVTIRSFALILQSIRSWRMTSTNRVPSTATWNYFSSSLPNRFGRSPKVVKEAIINDIDDLVQEFWRTSSRRAQAVGATLFAMRRLFDILERSTNSNLWHYSSWSDPHDQIKTKFKILFEGYRKMFDRSISKSNDLGDMLRFLPGVVVQNCLSRQGMADLYRIKPELLDRFIKFIIAPLNPSPFDTGIVLDDYLSRFLQDRDRSHLYYCDPLLQHISICRQILSLLDGSNFQSSELSKYVDLHFYDHLCAATRVFLYSQNISDDHPAVEIFRGLETAEYYVDENLSDSSLARRIIQAILRWTNMLNCRLKGVAVSVSNFDLMERVGHLTNKIYREMLCTIRHEGKTYIITTDGLDYVQVGIYSRTPLYGIILSWDLLDWIAMESRIPSSFTNFITSPELSGPSGFYIGSGIYHTQITEFLLEILYHLHLVGPGWNWSFREHLPHALATELIFDLLRSIPSKRLQVCIYSPELMLDTLEIILKWLQKLGSERPSDLYDRFQGELLRHKNTLPRRALNVEFEV